MQDIKRRVEEYVVAVVVPRMAEEEQGLFWRYMLFGRRAAQAKAGAVSVREVR